MLENVKPQVPTRKAITYKTSNVVDGKPNRIRDIEGREKKTNKQELR